MFDPINGPCVYATLSVSTTPVLLKVGATALEERKTASMMPINGTIYYGFDSSVTSLTGTPVLKKQFYEDEYTDNVTIYLVAASGTVDVRITEKA